MVGQQIEMIADDQASFINPRRLFGKLWKLNQQAIAQVFRRHADGVETLDALEHRFNFFKSDFIIANTFNDLFDRNSQVPCVINGIDDWGRNGAIGIGKWREFNLPHQVILQALRGLALIDGQFIILIIDAVAWGRSRGIDLIPAGIKRQLVGHLFLLKGIDGIQRFAILGLFGFYLIVKIGLLQQRVAVQRLLEFLLEF